MIDASRDVISYSGHQPIASNVTVVATMNANKQLMRQIFAELSHGNGRPFIEHMADDFSWTIMGSTPWSGTYRGKQTVLDELLTPLFSQFAGRYINTGVRFVAEGDYVVVECRGQVTTRAGKPYNNSYCWVCRLADGKLQSLTEYLDTQLVVEALTGPADRGQATR